MKKIFLTLILGILLIGLISASVDYEEQNKTYTIDTIIPNWLGGEGESYVKLVDNTDHCLIDCSATLEFNNELPLNLMEDFNIYNRSGDSVLDDIKSLEFLLGKYQNVSYSEPIYNYSCEDIYDEINNTYYESCSNEIIGYNNYTKEELIWDEYNGEEEQGLSYLRINAKKDIYKSVDWILTFRGEELSEWAWWNSGWLYKKQITNLTGSIIRINVTYDAHMKSDFSDIRFTNYSENEELSYWLEQKSNGSSAIFRIKSKGANSIYMYYGNGGASSTSNVSAVYGTGLIYFFPMENSPTGNLTNAVTGNSDAQPFNMDATNWVNGVIGKSLKFDGNNEYLRVPDSATADSMLSIIVLGNFTQASQSNYNRYLVGKSDGYQYAFSLRYDTVGRYVKYYDSGGTEEIDIVDKYSLNKWNSFAMKIDGSNMSGWVNGRSYDSSSQASEFSNAFPIYIGGGILNRYYTGYIDEVMIWNRAITDSEITTINNTKQPGAVFGAEETNAGLSIDYLTPPTLADGTKWTYTYIPVAVNVTYQNITFSNITYRAYKGGVLNQTKFYTNETYSINFTTCLCDNWKYNVTVCGISDIDSSTVCQSTTTRTVYIDILPPQINITSPSGNFNYLYQNYSLDLNWSVVDSGGHLDSCWYIYNGISNKVSCSLNHTNFNYTKGKNNITFYANDTFGNINNVNVNFGYLVFENSVNYSSSLYEGQYNPINYNLSLNGSLSSILINSGGVNHSVTTTIVGSNYLINSNEFVSSTLLSYNQFYLIININGINVLTRVNNQTFISFDLALCNSTVNNSFVSFILKDEKNINRTLNGTGEYVVAVSTPYTDEIYTFNGTFTGSNVSICSTINFTSTNFTFYSGGRIKYTSAGFSNENYNFIKQSIPKDIVLYLLNTSYVVPFKITYYGSTNLPESDAILELWKEYQYLNTYLIVEAPITSTTGEALFNIDSQNSKYKVKVYDDDYVLKRTFENQIFSCDTALVSLCSKDLYGIIESDSLSDPNKNFDFSITSTNTSLNITYEYINGIAKTTNTVVTKEVNEIKTVVYNQTIYSNNGEFNIPVSSSKLNEKYNIIIISENNLIFSGDFVPVQKTDKNGYLISIILLLTLVGMSVTSGVIVVLISLIGFLLAGLFLLINGIELGWNSLGYLSPLILIVALIIWKLSNIER